MKFVVIGAGAAGTTAAQYLREKSPQAEIVIFTNENYPYYGRPRLVEFLADEAELQQIYFHDEQWYQTNRIELRKGETVTKLDPENHKIFSGEKEHSYDKLLLACGARSADLPIEGVHRDGVFTLWSISDVIHMKQFARKSGSALVLGGGFLGIESARALRDMGLDVTLVDLADRLLPKYLDEEGAELLRGVVEGLGITVVLGEMIERIEAATSAVEKVHFASGKTVPAEVVLIAAGAVPNKEIGQNAGLVTNKGVIVDKHMRTSSSDIYAAGDVAEFAGRCYGIVPAALEQAKVAASNMIVEDALTYDGTVPINTLKGLGADVTCIGLSVPEYESKYEVLRVSEHEAGVYKKAVLEKDKLLGVILIGSRKNVVPLTTIISRKLDVSSVKDSLLDEGANLQDFIRQSEE
jgi:nitrite reductase (NADH) large subunit